jgi:hypothetical protein
MKLHLKVSLQVQDQASLGQQLLIESKEAFDLAGRRLVKGLETLRNILQFKVETTIFPSTNLKLPINFNSNFSKNEIDKEKKK